MSEREWLTACSVEAMLEVLGGNGECPSLERKLFLFGCACVRRVGRFFGHPDLHAYVDLCERHAEAPVESSVLERAQRLTVEVIRGRRFVDPTPEGRRYQALLSAALRGEATRDEVLAARQAADASAATVKEWPRHDYRALNAAQAVWACRSAWQASHYVTVSVAYSRAADGADYDSSAIPGECSAHASLLREIVGNPYQADRMNALRFGEDVRGLAEAIFRDAAFGRVPELSRELTRSGITDPLLHSHCQEKEGHVHGCWAVDLIRGHPIPVARTDLPDAAVMCAPQ